MIDKSFLINIIPLSIHLIFVNLFSWKGQGFSTMPIQYFFSSHFYNQSVLYLMINYGSCVQRHEVINFELNTISHLLRVTSVNLVPKHRIYFYRLSIEMSQFYKLICVTWKLKFSCACTFLTLTANNWLIE